jgi:hypothetical protein
VLFAPEKIIHGSKRRNGRPQNYDTEEVKGEDNNDDDDDDDDNNNNANGYRVANSSVELLLLPLQVQQI